MDHSLVRRLRAEVAEGVAAQRQQDAAAGLPPMSPEDERQFAQALLAQALESHARAEVIAGRRPLTADDEEQLAEAVQSALYGVGRLQPLLDDPSVENIDINGCDVVFVSYSDGREESADPVAESDEELVELIQLLGAYSGLASRSFDSANPQLDLRLPDGSRLSAVMDVCARPSISIRRNRLQKVFLSDLVGTGSMSEELQGFLSAAVAARKNIMISGATNAGKTTLLRALANEIPPAERLVTVERALELGLGDFPDLHPNVVAFEERLPNSEGQGHISMADLVRRSLRMNPSRVIVGEVLGDEIVTMLNAMTQGNDGSLSTIHANSAIEVFNRIATYAIQAQERLPVEATHMLIAGALDFVIFVEKRNDYSAGGRLRRFISSVREVNGIDGRVLSTEVFAFGPDGFAAPHAPISCLDDLLAVGYEPDRPGHGRYEGVAGMTGLLAVLAGAMAGAGLALAVLAMTGSLPQGEVKHRDLNALIERTFRRGVLAVVTGVLVLVISRWLVAAIAIGGLVFLWPALFGAATSTRRDIGRLEALATWTESLRDTIAGAVGLEQAIPASLRAAPPAIERPLRMLVNRLRSREMLAPALVKFADDFDDPSADLIVAALVLNARLRGPGLRDVLGELSESARAEVDMRRRVEAQRRSTRRSVQIVTGVVLLVAGALVVFNRDFLSPYDSAFGQVMLAAIIGVFALGFVWLRRLARFDAPGRFLSSRVSDLSRAHFGAGT